MYKRILAVSLSVLVASCGFKNQDIAVGKNGSVVAYNNLDKHSALALFQSQEGKACYETISKAFDSEKVDDAKYSPSTTVSSNPSSAAAAMVASMSQAMVKMQENAMKYASHMIAYSNGITPVEQGVMALANICKKNGYYDAKIKTQAERQATYRSIVSEVGGVFKAIANSTPYAALAYLGSKTGDKHTVNGDNSAVGDGNGVATPTVVEQPEPTIRVVRPEVVNPEVVIIGGEEAPAEEPVVEETPVDSEPVDE